VKISRLKDPASALTHGIGALLAVAGLAVLVYQGVVHGTVWHVVSFSIFGASLIGLYTASTLYHALDVSPRASLTLRKVDHIMIFFLIAGTYTPFCLLPLRGAWGWSLFGAIWGCAVVGMVVKLFWMSAPRWLYTGFYVLMGWLVVVAAYPLVQRALPVSLVWMLAGGVFYTVGAVFYALKWPDPWPDKFGFHEIWHLFVMAGSLAHFAAVLYLISPKGA
jgi:hemolysin III